MGVRSTINDLVNRLFKRGADSAEKSGDTLGHLSGRGSEDEAIAENARHLEEGAAEADKALHKEAGKQARKGLFKATGIDRPTRWGMDLMHKAFDAIGKAYNRLIKTVTPAKVAVGAGAVGGLMAMSAAIDYAIPARDPPPRRDVVALDSGFPVVIDIPSPLPDISPFPTDLVTSDEEFAAVLARLEIAIARLDVEALLDPGREQVVLDTAPLPPRVELYAGARIPISVLNGRDSRTGTTTVGELYQAMPEARGQIEQHFEESRGANLQVNITVKAEFASISITG